MELATLQKVLRRDETLAKKTSPECRRTGAKDDETSTTALLIRLTISLFLVLTSPNINSNYVHVI